MEHPELGKLIFLDHTGSVRVEVWSAAKTRVLTNDLGRPYQQPYCQRTVVIKNSDGEELARLGECDLGGLLAKASVLNDVLGFSMPF